MTDKTYSNKVISVRWQDQLCAHCGNCVDALPAVFNVNARPWINLDGATPEAITAAVNDCPSGAISIAKC